jgi:flagellar L-ring protein precursor FlgH
MISRGLFFKTIFIVAIAVSLLNTGCATFESMFGDSDVKTNSSQMENDVEGNSARKTFSQNPHTFNPPNRQYRKMTKSRMEEESELHSQAGSMWVMEGQGAYLFSQNKTRREGDLLNVSIDQSAKKQVETKVSVIRKLLKQLEEEEYKQNNPEAIEQQKLAEQDQQKQGANGTIRAPASTPKEEKEEPVDIAQVPTRIVERMADGNYRVKGQQPFMIGKREYKVIVTGVIRPEDFNDQGVTSEKLLDPQYDVVSIRRKE